jgi:PAS domain S-box-containing protein
MRQNHPPFDASGLALVLDDAPIPLWVSDPEGRRVAVNRAWLDYAGRAEPEELGYGWANGIHPDDAERCLAAHRAAARERSGLELEYRLRRSDGEYGWLLDRARARFGGSGAFLGHVGSSTDVTHLKRVEAELRQAETMGAVSRLAGGVAHRFNNVLTGVLGYSDLLETGFAPDDARRESVAEIRKAAELGADLTGKLLCIGRRQALRPELVDANELARDAASELSGLVGPRIELRTRLSAPAGSVYVDPDQIGQVILGLAANACDAMPDGGTLTLSTAGGASNVLLSVEDTGAGVGDSVRPHLFEPFVTTKEPGRGLGLGLAVAYGIVKQSGGRLEAETRPGRGACFTIHLPRARQATPVEPPALPPEQIGRGGTILLVEGEPVERRRAETALSGRGHRLLVAATGEEAVGIAAGFGAPIDVLVTDIVLGGMSGIDVAEHLSRQRPGIRVVYVSGYADAEAMRVAGVGPTGLVPRPLSPEALADRVEEALAAPAAE